MSVDAMSWAFEQDLPVREKFVLVCISDGAGAEGFFMPPNDILERKTGMSKTEIDLAIKSLIEMKLIGRTGERIDDRDVFEMRMS